MSFELVGGAWRVSFLEENLRTPLRATFAFQDSEKVIETARRGGALSDLATRQGIEHGIRSGRGGTWLALTPAQYQKLR